MKKFNLNEKGFTLIELLAVIVILAIVMVLASQSVLPFMRNASKDSFVIEANGVIDAASNAISLYNVGQMSEMGESKNITLPLNDENKTNVVAYKKLTNGFCFSIAYLVDRGVYSLKYNKINDKNYGGYVIAKKASSDSNNYTYTLNFENKDFYVSNFSSGAVTADDVHEQDGADHKITSSCAGVE
jgi:prepilin-type N-terminal cleavage/methylation domain-containing protein